MIHSLSNIKEQIHENEQILNIKIMTNLKYIIAVNKNEYIYNIRLFMANILKLKYNLLYLSLNGKVLDEFANINEITAELEQTDNILQIIIVDINNIVPEFLKEDIIITCPLISPLAPTNIIY